MSDKSMEFYKDPVNFCTSRIHNTGSRVFQARLLNKPTVFVCSVKGMKEMLVDKKYHIVRLCPTREEAHLLRLSLMQLFKEKSLDAYGDYINSSEPVAIYRLFKRLATELSLGLFLNVDAEESAALTKQIIQLTTQHWHGKSTIILMVCPHMHLKKLFLTRLKLKLIGKCVQTCFNLNRFVNKIKNIPFPENTSATQHLLLFISALIPKALASLLTSFTLALAGSNQIHIHKCAQESEDYLNNVLLEVQRLWPSFIGGRRIAKQDTTLCGYMIPKGYSVMFIAFAVHRDPDYFDHPDEFLPERWSERNAGQENVLCCFGNGPRNCIGIELNNMIVKAAARYLLSHYTWSLDPPTQTLDYKWLPVSRPAEDPTIKFMSYFCQT
uniref:Cytochrome P450 3A9-like n=1 Tax=Callorhinchus milii TaxID=7868 RepID=A0A4W3JG51_CALMI